ncbi:MAG TPA: glycosyl hydrolase 115 family protein [Verrucomicrobiae bacterium]|nr:glycosyl hydrolase 115 family protein [Verrucomicrobiae bacterium]
MKKRSAADIFVDTNDFVGVARTANDLRQDVTRVTGIAPKIISARDKAGRNVVIIGTLGKNGIIDQLVREGKLDVTQISGKWESFLIQVIPNPLPHVASALVIAGSDKRGAIYGIYDLSQQMGVSPWYYWADVTARHRAELFVKAGRYAHGPPSVKYRGIFLNDEAPDLSNWVREKYGSLKGMDGDPANYGHAFYTNVFELILRLKGNYLWPAMWNNAFNEDDPENTRLADEYGIVMGTSHQEPMMRAQKEWDRRYRKTLGSWNYAKEPDLLGQFWREGIERNKNFENIITLGLRGANDTPMAEGGPEANKALLEKIVDVQRKMIGDVINSNVAQVPQMWCLYKEVMDFYNAGMRVPDDVTLLWAEDNWGDVRRLPTADERKRSGGAGIYYHFDYHGGPRSYQWLDTSPLPKIWDQMSLAKQYGADRIWIVNVGHLKGYELPMEYFMDLAWDSDKWTNDNLSDYVRLWAAREFGPEHAAEIASIVAKYTKYNGRRKPELLDANTYSVVNYNEAGKVVADFETIAERAEKIALTLPKESQNAFYELVLFPVKACAVVNELYFAAARNELYARQGRASANDEAAEVRSKFTEDTNLMNYFNHDFAGGKWDHFMDQAHLGYRGWADPPSNNFGAIKLREIEVQNTAAMGVAIEGSEAARPGTNGDAVLPQFDALSRRQHYIEVFKKGKRDFEFVASASEPWIVLSERKGSVGKDKKIWVKINWERAPKGTATGTIKIKGAGTEVAVTVNALNPIRISRKNLRGFAEGEGIVAIEPEHFTRNRDAGSNRWIRIEDYGRTLSGMRATGPTDVSATPGKDSPCLEYQMYLFDAGPAEIVTITSPILNFVPGRGVRFAVSFDDDVPQVVTLVPEKYSAQNGNQDWETSVKDNARYAKTTLKLARPGYHTLKYWMIDPGVVLQKVVVDMGGLKPSYLGPPESYHQVPSEK